MPDSIAENPSSQPTHITSPPPDPGTLNGIDAQLAGLPPFARELLQIRVPVQVTLASQRKSLQEILELGPGSIVKFAKTWDEPMELGVHGRTVARGEVVKVGDKFGLRITSIAK